jgi:hypothetical protein
MMSSVHKIKAAMENRAGGSNPDTRLSFDLTSPKADLQLFVKETIFRNPTHLLASMD